ncbi:hypothetical protein C8Q80DRAFT_1268977 [Daedaleopsis nitida]|nr:hypothetical protein C8Q80DRAFT_1268977 [Daedaleopsis nitida]
MRAAKKVISGKSKEKSKNVLSDGNKAHGAAGATSNRSSESDDDDVMRQLRLSPVVGDSRAHATTSRGAVASRRNGIPDGPAGEPDRRRSGSHSSEDDELLHTSSTRSGRGVGTDSPATTPVGSPSQTPGLGSSSSEDLPQQVNGMDIDSEGPGRGSDIRSNEARTAEASVTERPFNISYIPCHTWPPCAVCARINGEPPQAVATSSFMVVRQRQLVLAREAARNASVARQTTEVVGATVSANPPSLRLPQLGRPSDSRPQFIPPPLSPPPMPYDPPLPPPPPPPAPPRPAGPLHPHQHQEIAVPPRMLPAGSLYPSSYPMEPLFVSAGVAPGPQAGRGNGTNTYRGGAPGPATTIPHVIRQVTLSSVSAPVRTHPYPRPPRPGSDLENAQASSSSLRIEDMRTPHNAGERRLRGRGRQKSKKIRAKRYNRKKREEWPPEGWNPIWEEERPRRWEGYDIPDDVATDKVYDHLRRRFDLKSMGHCKWEGCIPTDASKDGYKMLKRHVETVHLGLKLVCKLCGVRKRADNRRKATHKRGCPEREEGPGTLPTPGEGAGPSMDPDALAAGGLVRGAGKARAVDGQMVDEEDLVVDDGEEGYEDEGEEEDELEEDELEEDQLEEDQEGMDHPMESEFESEDD